MTCSIGVACTDYESHDSAQEFLNQADRAMYIAKHTTKNRVVAWPPAPEELALAEQNAAKERGLRMGNTAFK